MDKPPAGMDNSDWGDSVEVALGLLRELAASTPADHGAMRRRANEILKRLEARRTALRTSKGRLRERQRAVDEWLLDIFRATESALPRETLVQEFMVRWADERRVGNRAAHAGPWLFLFATESDGEGRKHVVARQGYGVHEEAFESLCRLHLPQAESDPYLSRVMFEGGDIEGWHASWFDASPLFEGLLDIRQRFGGERNYWVSAIPLPGDPRHAPLGLFVLHPNLGDLLDPEPPSTLRQDQRLLMALSLAWAQLEHRVARMAAFTERDRRAQLQAIAPGLLHHELGNYLRTLYGQAYEHFGLLKHAATATPSRELQIATHYAHAIGKLALSAHRVTHVFNNFEKRAQIESVTLDTVVDDVLTLMHHRLGEAGTAMQWDQEVLAAITVHTDVVLLSQALINVVANAINALIEGETPAPRAIQLSAALIDDGLVRLAVCNNGPAIDAALHRDLFRQGFTTRASGHGQGLYLVRRIAHYLRGDATLLSGAVLPAGMHAGFAIDFTQRFSAGEGLARAVDETA